jgi:hypothetical protein
LGAVIHGEAEPVVAAHDGLQNLRVTEVINRPARTEAIVSLV